MNQDTRTFSALEKSHQALLAALHIAEAALSDIGDAQREPGDDVAWCERRAAQDLSLVRKTLAEHRVVGNVDALDAVKHARAKAFEEAAVEAASWRGGKLLLHAGEMTAQEKRTAEAVSAGISRMIRSHIGKPSTSDLEEAKVQKAIDLAIRQGLTENAHHKAYFSDQIVRALAGDRYDAVIAKAQAGEDGPHTYSWSTGSPP